MNNLLKYLAKLTLWRFNPEIIAVTGSVGKTSALEAIYAVLTAPRQNSKAMRVRVGRGDFSGTTQACLTILRDLTPRQLFIFSKKTPEDAEALERGIYYVQIILGVLTNFVFINRASYPTHLLLEYSSSRPGEIKSLLEIAKPYVAIITAMGDIPAHLERWSGPDALHREKARLIEHLSANGFAVLNYDDSVILKMKERTRAKIVTFGFDEGADVRISNFVNRSEDNVPYGISFKLEYGGSVVPIFIKNLFGRQEAYAAAIGACVGLIYDMNLIEIAEGLRGYSLTAGLKLINGVKDTRIIQGISSSSPVSMKEALVVLHDLPGSRKIAVLGDMLELGEYTIRAHEGIGRVAGDMADVLFTIGLRGKLIADGAKKHGMNRNKISSFDTPEEALEPLLHLIKKGDLVLISGSRDIGLEKITDGIRRIPS